MYRIQFLGRTTIVDMDIVRQIGMTEFALCLGILLTPVIPTGILLLLDFRFVPFFIILALLYAISLGPLIGLLAFFFISVIYLERNRRKIQIARYKFADIVDINTPNQMTVEDEGIPQDTVPVREFETPDDRTMYYIPRDGCAVNSNGFTPLPADESLNHKIVFPTIPQGSKAAAVYQAEGFGRDSNNVI